MSKKKKPKVIFNFGKKEEKELEQEVQESSETTERLEETVLESVESETEESNTKKKEDKKLDLENLTYEVAEESEKNIDAYAKKTDVVFDAFEAYHASWQKFAVGGMNPLKSKKLMLAFHAESAKFNKTSESYLKTAQPTETYVSAHDILIEGLKNLLTFNKEFVVASKKGQIGRAFELQAFLSEGFVKMKDAFMEFVRIEEEKEASKGDE